MQTCEDTKYSRTCLKLIKFRSSDRDFLLFYIIFSRLALIYFIITVQGIL